LGVTLTAEDSALIAASVQAFNCYLQRLAPILLRNEEPFIRLDDSGTVITGTIDLLVETADGFWIVDHKSDQIGEAELADRVSWYYPQLRAYADAVAAICPTKVVHGILLNWISLGMITVIENDF
jgi:ATP-dependent exoDNAse (exonuclease V) beta subunit